MITAILQLFGRVLLWIYNTCGSYALALALFTLLTKLILFPVSYKGKRGMMQMNTLNQEQMRLQKQYGKDKERYQMEVQKLYEREKVNPMGGCLWSFLPLPILMGLYYVIRRPMMYMLCLTEEQINTVISALGQSFAANQTAYQEIHIMNMISRDPAMFETAKNALGEVGSKLQPISFNFIGIDLGTIPSFKFWTWDTVDWNHIGLFLIPIVVTALNFFYTQYSMKSNKVRAQQNADETKKDDQQSSMEASNKVMMYTMPLMYLWFGYIMPAGMCIYMACSAIFSALQEMIFSKFLNKKFAAEEEERRARMEAERAQEKERKAEAAARRAEKEEQLKTKKGRKAAKMESKKSKDSAAGQVGVRRYARGRSYEAERYPVTSYRDPQDVIDEAALENALKKRKKKNETAAEAAEDILMETSPADVTAVETAANAVELNEAESAEEIIEETTASDEQVD